MRGHGSERSGASRTWLRDGQADEAGKEKVIGRIIRAIILCVPVAKFWGAMTKPHLTLNASECDAFSRKRHIIRWRRNERKAIKRSYARRLRRALKQTLSEQA